MREQTVSIRWKQMSWNEATISIEVDDEVEFEELGTLLGEALAQHLKMVRGYINKKDKADVKMYNDSVKMLLDDITKTIIS